MMGQRLHWRTVAAVSAVLLAIAALIVILIDNGNHKPAPPATPVQQPASARQTASATIAEGGFPTVKGGGGGGTTGGGGTGGGGGGTGGGGAGGSVQNTTIAISPSAGWKVVGKDDFHLYLTDPGEHGLLGLESGGLKGSVSLTQYVQAVLTETVKGGQNPSICGKAQAVTLPNGPKGVYVPVCYTIVPTNGQAFQAYAGVLVGLSGHVGMAIKWITPASASIFNAFLKETGQFLGSLHWKLLQG